MRKQFVKTVTELLEKDERVVLLLGDIGVYGFREAFDRFPKRVYNIGILEQASVGLAAGLAQAGMIPIFHTIAPFMVERAFEQIKIDFGYQKLAGNFISVGGSYDYAGLGCTHHCPGDVMLMQTIPGMQIFVPGHPVELNQALRQVYNNGSCHYFRLSERSNKQAHMVYQQDTQVKDGKKASIIAVGPMLDKVVEACKDLDVEILYRTVIQPTLGTFTKNRTVIFVEPYYEGTSFFIQKFSGQAVSIGVPLKFLTGYGKPEDLDREAGLTVEQIRERIEELC